MSKLTKKIIIICLLIILCALTYMVAPLIHKITILLKSNAALNDFKNAENSKYTYELTRESQTHKKVIYKKGNKYKELEDNQFKYYDDYSILAYGIGNDRITVYNDLKIFYVADYYMRAPYASLINDSGIEYIIKYGKSLIFKIKGVWACLDGIIPDKIVSEEFEGRDCYKLTTVFAPKSESKYSSITITVMYIDKETFLPVYTIKNLYEKGDYIRKLDEETKTTYRYEVGVVTDEDVDLPDLSDYTQKVDDVYTVGYGL